MNRRGFVARALAWAGLCGAGSAAVVQRVSQPVANRLEYVLHAGQEWYTLIRLDGTQVRPDQVTRVFVKFANGGDTILLHPEQYQVVDWGLRFSSRIMRWHSEHWIERVIVEHV